MASNATKYTAKLVNKRVVVFGGTSGVGFAVAEAAIEHGAEVTICGSTQEKLDNSLRSLRENYPATAPNKINGCICDLSNRANMEGNVEKALSKISGGSKTINHVVFTAGDVFLLPAITDLNAEELESFGTVRFAGGLVVAKVLHKYMELRPENSFTMTGGTNTAKPGQGWTVIAGWGAALEGMTRGLAVDMKPLRVNIVTLGAVLTPLFKLYPEDQLEAILESFRKGNLLNMVAKPEDVAEAYIYAMKDRFVTGTMISTDGGRLLC